MKKLSIVAMLLILGFICSVQAKELAQILNPQFNGIDLSIPKSINFQGYLYRDGTPMDTTIEMWFGIYDSPGGGNLLYQQYKPTVEILNGWFTVNLTNIPDSVFNFEGPIRYLEVEAPITQPPLEPRIPLVSVGYSYHSFTSDTAEYARQAQVVRPIFPPIETPEIGNYVVTNPKLGNNAVTTQKIEDATIRGIDIAKPCTLQASTPYPGAIFRVVNSGAGDGIEIGSVGNDGFRVMRASDDGFQVDSAQYGFVLYRASDDGLWIARAGNNGVYVDSARHGLYIKHAANSGVNIDSSLVGVWVYHTDQSGYYIGRARYHGLEVWRADANGVQVFHASQDGFKVDSAGMFGLHVEHANVDGIRIDSVADDGLQITKADWGVYVDEAFTDGVYIGNAGRWGVRVFNAQEDGLNINNADNYGVYVNQAGLYGVFARTNNSSTTAGVRGEGPITSTGAYGVYGYARNKGVYGRSNYWEGVFGQSDSDDAVEGYYNGTFSSYAGVRGRRGSSGYGVYYEGGLGGSGTKNAIVRTSKGPVALYCQESPENWFEDFGEGKLVNGHCRIDLEKLFLETVTINDRYPIKVFVQLTSGEPMNLVVKKDLNGFDLIAEDLTSNATFDYRVVAKRKGFEDLRLKIEEIGYTDHLLYPDLNDPQIPTKIRAKRLEEIENRMKEETIRKNNRLEKIRKEEKPSRLEKR